MSHDLTVREDGTVEMFSAGSQPVWHRLGQRTETAVTSTAAIRMADIDGNLVLNPTFEERKASDLDLVMGGTSAAVAMVESGSNCLTEAPILEALGKGGADGFRDQGATVDTPYVDGVAITIGQPPWALKIATSLAVSPTTDSGRSLATTSVSGSVERSMCFLSSVTSHAMAL